MLKAIVTLVLRSHSNWQLCTTREEETAKLNWQKRVEEKAASPLTRREKLPLKDNGQRRVGGICIRNNLQQQQGVKPVVDCFSINAGASITMQRHNMTEQTVSSAHHIWLWARGHTDLEEGAFSSCF